MDEKYFDPKEKWNRAQMIRGDRRLANRHSLTGIGRFTLDTGDVTVEGRLLDLSTTGVAICTLTEQLSQQVGELGFLTIESDDLPAAITCIVSIMRHFPLDQGCYKVGLEIVSIDEENFRKISAFHALVKARAAREASA